MKVDFFIRFLGLVFWNSIHLEVASDSFCFLINSSWLLVFILYVFFIILSGFNLNNNINLTSNRPTIFHGVYARHVHAHLERFQRRKGAQGLFICSFPLGSLRLSLNGVSLLWIVSLADQLLAALAFPDRIILFSRHVFPRMLYLRLSVT